MSVDKLTLAARGLRFEAEHVGGREASFLIGVASFLEAVAAEFPDDSDYDAGDFTGKALAVAESYLAEEF